jgi:hypothetical protein
MKAGLFTLFLFYFINYWLSAQNGIIKGKVFDAISNEPIAFASVLIEGTGQGVTTDIDGNYELKGLEPNLYNVSASYLGYKKKTETEIQVTNAKPAVMDFALAEQGENAPVVEVKASAFYKTEESPVSLRTIGTAEIARNPGGGRDISKVVRILPGVTTTASFRNDLLIRGGAPNENRFFLDDVEIPNINHFATQGASGGPNGLLNVDFIREVDFYSGAFPANRGNSLSSVFNFKQKNGRDDRLGFTLTSGTSEVALSVEGPLSKKTTFIVSARQSFLQLLFKAIGLPFLPTYNDFQFKVRTQIDSKNELYFVGLGALDQFKLNLEANETPSQRFLLNNLPVNNQWSYAMGAVYRHSRANSYWTFVLSRNMLDNKIFKYVDNDESQEKFIDYKSQESENKLRIENTARFASTWKLNYGVGYELARYFNSSKTFELVNGTATPVFQEALLYLSKYTFFGQLSNKFFDEKLTISAGLRADGNSFSAQMANPIPQLSPRLSVAYNILPNLAANFNGGIYYQLPAYTTLGYTENGEFANKDRVSYIRSSHLVAGLEYYTKTNTKISVEGYFKYYQNYPFLLNQQIALANLGGDFGVIGAAPIDNSAVGRAYGLEFLVQQRLYKGFFGIVSYTLGKTEFKDANNNYVPSSWDSRHILNVALGKSWTTMSSDIRSKQNASRIAKGRPAKSDKVTAQTFDFGINARMQTGLPYTPFDEQASALTQNWNRFGRGLPDYTRLNQSRSPLFYAIDLRVDYKWFFQKWSFNLYFDIQNLPGVVSGAPALILEQGDNGDQPVQTINQGQPNESYLLRSIPAGAGTSVPTLGIIIQY